MENSPIHVLKLSDSYFKMISNELIKEENEKVSKEKNYVASEEDNIQISNKVDEEIKNENLSILKTIGTGKFSRVFLSRHDTSLKYYGLKIMSMEDVIKMEQVEHVHNEKNVLKSIFHPFLISLAFSTIDTRFLYLLFPYVPGGELFSYLRSMKRFHSSTALFYTAEVVSALGYLHSLGIIYRDIKPENLLLDGEGHLKIVDFGFSKEVRDKTWTLCGTPEYIAPEIILDRGYGMSVDWWALGVLVFEMVVGYPPFQDRNMFDLYDKILGESVKWPTDLEIEPAVTDFVSNLLVKKVRKRLGCGGKGAEEVKNHSWLKPLDWSDVVSAKLSPL